MIQHNIFITGGQVSGESMVGYQRYINEIKQNVLDKIDGTGGICMTGLPRMGKTSLAHATEQALAQETKNLITINFDLSEYDAQQEYMFERLLLDITEEIFDNYKNILQEEEPLIEKQFQKIKDCHLEDFSLRRKCLKFFETLHKRQLCILLILDEFDSAQNIFKNKADFEFFRSLTSNLKYSAVLLTISRQPLHMIENETPNSTFNGVMTPISIYGFSEEEFQLVFQILQEHYHITLTEEEKEILEHYCGNSPYLWSYFCHKIVEQNLAGNKKSISDIYKQELISVFSAYYNNIYKLLEKSKIDSQYSYADILNGILNGPSYFIKEDDIDILKQLGYLYEDKKQYCSVSYSFMKYLKEHSTDKETPLTAVITLEKQIKLLLKREKDSLFLRSDSNENECWYQLLEQAYIQQKSTFTRRSLYDSFIRNNKNEYSINSTVLDVMSLSDAFRIIGYHWRIFFALFGGKNYAEWKPKFIACGKARNPLAHGHEEFLSTEQQKQVISYSHEIMNQIKNEIQQLSCFSV